MIAHGQAQQHAKGADSVGVHHGFNSPVQDGGPQQPAFVQTIQSLSGIANCKDINGGKPNYVAYTLNVIFGA